MVKLICMSFEGDYVTEGTFDSVQDAWERSEDMGSRWFFYPFHFVTTESEVCIDIAYSAPQIKRRVMRLARREIRRAA